MKKKKKKRRKQAIEIMSSHVTYCALCTKGSRMEYVCTKTRRSIERERSFAARKTKPSRFSRRRRREGKKERGYGLKSRRKGRDGVRKVKKGPGASFHNAP